jgi:type IV pilus assembly protein PilW
MARTIAGGRRCQSGLTLVELAVSIVIGLLTIAVALAALTVSRHISGTVSDAAQLQQQAAHALRVIGQQVRQAGSVELNLAANTDGWNQPGAGVAIPLDDTVVFMTTGYAGITNVISGTDAGSKSSATLTLRYSNYWQPNAANDQGKTLFRSCLGNGGEIDSNGQPEHRLLTSIFSFDENKQELKCADGTGAGAQAVIKNVAGFQVAYLVQTPDGNPPTVWRTNAAGVGGHWDNVDAVEVCLDMAGDERMDLPADAKYTNCADQRVSLQGRLHMAFKNTFQLRSQGFFLPPPGS